MEKRQAFQSQAEITNYEEMESGWLKNSCLKNYPRQLILQGCGNAGGKMFSLAYFIFFLLFYIFIFVIPVNYKNRVSIKNKITLLWIWYLAKYFLLI